MAICDIKAHSTDNTRIKLIIPGKQHFYMRAVNATKKQGGWLPMGAPKHVWLTTGLKKKKKCETSISLKTKMSELHLYCDLLIEEVHPGICSPSWVSFMSETSSLLSATFNTFITTTKDCMMAANAKFKPDMFNGLIWIPWFHWFLLLCRWIVVSHSSSCSSE